MEEEEELAVAVVAEKAQPVAEDLLAAISCAETPLGPLIESAPEARRTHQERILGVGCGLEAGGAQLLGESVESRRRRDLPLQRLRTRIEPGEETQVGDVRQRKRRADALEAAPASHQLAVDGRGRRALVPVAREMICAQRVEGDEDEVPL